ncbi:ferredoxin [Nocardia carnea]|uniref:ferredoxin n=1 Tax=Nocardia carnea TaxID=37328 RepID=UPI002453908B|nr:ferredoxin [Nocardia carnea]
MKVRVDDKICQGHTICAMVAPEIFALRDEDGHSYAPAGGEVPAGFEAAAGEAVRSCPERAIEEILEA